MSIDPPIPVIQLLKKVTFKIQGQGHGWGQSSKSQSGSKLLSSHIPLFSCQSGTPHQGYSFFKIWPWNSKVKVIAQGHIVGSTSYRLTFLSLHDKKPSHPWERAFDLWNPRSGSWVRSKFKVPKWDQLPIDTHPFHSLSISPPVFGFYKIGPWKSKVKIIVQGHIVGLTSYQLMSLCYMLDDLPTPF